MINADTVGQIFCKLAPKDLLYPVQSKWLLDKLLIEQLDMIPPESFLMGTVPRWIRTKTPPFLKLIDEEEYGVRIPFLESLKNLLKNEDIRNEIDNPMV